MTLLANLNFQAYEALGLFALWFIQFCVPHWREEVAIAYAVWLAIELVSTRWRPGRLKAFSVFPSLWNMAARKRAERSERG